MATTDAPAVKAKVLEPVAVEPVGAVVASAHDDIGSASKRLPVVKFLNRGSYEHMSKDMLVDVICQRDDELRQHRRLLQNQGRAFQRYQSKAVVPASTDDALQIAYNGPAEKTLSFRGTLALGIRKAFTNGAAKDLALVLMEDISRQTIVRSEVELGAACIASCRGWISSSMQAARDLASSAVLALCVMVL